MRRLFKFLFSSFIGIILLLAISVTTLVTLVNPNHFKTQISRAVQERTGRKFTIHGNISWSFFPWAGLKIQDATLANPSEFNKKSFLNAGNIDISLKLWPLVLGKIYIGAIKLNHLHLVLIRNAAGHTNWHDLTTQLNQKKPSTTASTHTHTRFPSLHISTISVSDSDVEWIDKKKKQYILLSNLNLQSNNIGINKPFTITARSTINSKKPNLKANTEFSTLVTLAPQKANYRLQNTHIKITLNQLNNKTPKASTLPLKIDTNIILDNKQKTVTLNNLTIRLANMQIQASISGKSLDSTPEFNGKIQLLSFNPKETLSTFGQPLRLKNTQALEQASGSFTFIATPNSITLNNLKLSVDKANIEGSFSLADFTKSSINFDLHINKLLPEQYMRTNEQRDNTKNQTGAKDSRDSLSFLRNWQITNSSLHIDQLVLSKLNLQQVSAKITGKKGIIQIAPISAELYDGNLHGGITLDIQRKLPRYTINANLDKINIKKMLLETTNKAPITGTLALNTNLTTRGKSQETLIKTLNGKGSFSLNNGYIEGIDAGYILAKAAAIMNKQSKFLAFEKGPQQTTFDKVIGSFQIKNGLLHNQDMELSSPTLATHGAGKINLINEKINYLMKVTGVKSMSSNNGKETRTLNNWSVPIRITGTFSSPIFSPDFTDLAKQVVKKQIKKQIRNLNNLGKAVVGETLNKLFK